MTPVEQSIPLMPPSAPFSPWLSRALLAPWMRWDALWYERIVNQGYSATDGTTQFHPLYPWLAIPLARLGVSTPASLLIISSLAGIALFFLFYKLARYDLARPDAFYALFLFALAPPAFILFAPYSEALFLVCAVSCFIFLRNKSWWLAGLMGGLATLTRQQGILLLLPAGWAMRENAGRDLRALARNWKSLVSLLLIPAGYLVWVIYRAIALSDVKFDVQHPLAFFSSLLISPGGKNVVPIYGITWPWTAIRLGVDKLVSQADADIWINAILGLGFILFLIMAWKNINWGYRLYSVGLALVSFSLYTGPVHPYMGLPRHLLLAFPIFIGAALALNRPWKRLTLVGIFLLGWSFLLLMYGLQAWVP